MKEVPLTKGFFTLIDDEDFVNVSAHRWHYASGYAHNAKLGALHRFVLGAPKGQNVDHINGDPLDNRRENLRLATHGQNMMNKHVPWGRSKYKGVIWNKAKQTWFVRVQAEGKRVFVGMFRDEVEAAKAYNAKAIDVHESFAALNLIDGYTDGAEMAQAAKVTSIRSKDGASSLYRGVSVDTVRGGFMAAVRRGADKRSKRFTDEHAAATWYNLQAADLFGVHAILNAIPSEFAHYAALIKESPLAFTPKDGKASKHSNVFRNGSGWMVRFRKDGKTIFQVTCATEDEAARIAAEKRQSIEADASTWTP